MKKKRKAETTFGQKELIKKWENKWFDARRIEKDKDVFFIRYKEIYEDCFKKLNKNKDKNIGWKKAFLGLLLLGTALEAVEVIPAMIKRETSKYYYLNSVFIFFISICGAAIINKWIEIKKYQETWVRHSVHSYQLEKEMLKFVEEIHPYEVYPFQSDEKRCKMFIANILAIEEVNMELFSDNMNNKEKELMDVFEKVERPWKKENS